MALDDESESRQPPPGVDKPLNLEVLGGVLPSNPPEKQLVMEPHPFHIVGECQRCCDESEALRLGFPGDPDIGDCETPGCINGPVLPSNDNSPTDEKPRARSASYLAVPDFFRLSASCRPLKKAFGCYPYLVGSALYRPDFRDVDLRMPVAVNGGGRGVCDMVIDDEDRRLFLNAAVSDWLAKSTGLPIDFQFQPLDEWDTYSDRLRNPMGVGR